jgi:ligand-binding SRPBCC domain-containing protein
MKFRLLNPIEHEKLFPGMVFYYSLRPLLGIRIKWASEIIVVEEHLKFIDRQKNGPFSFWQHEHRFKSSESGTEMTDMVTYKNPMGIIGRWLDPLIVRKKLNALFRYRLEQTQKIFK